MFWAMSAVVVEAGAGWERRVCTDPVHSLYGGAEWKAWQIRVGTFSGSMPQAYVNSIVSGMRVYLLRQLEIPRIPRFRKLPKVSPIRRRGNYGPIRSCRSRGLSGYTR